MCEEFREFEAFLEIFKQKVKYDLDRKQIMKEMNYFKLVLDGYAKWLDNKNSTYEQIKVSNILKN